MKRLMFLLPCSLMLFICLVLSGGPSVHAEDQGDTDVRFRWAFGAMVGADGDRRLVAITRDTTLKTGDQLKMLVELRKNCFVYLIYRSGQDEISLLYGTAIAKTQATITELWTATDLVIYLDTDIIQSKPNPYGFIPFIIFPNVKKPKQFWGESDIPVLVQPQRELNRALSQLSRILELSGNPIAVLENVQSAEDIKVQPGALWTIPEDAKAYLLDLLQGGGVRLHIDYIDTIYRSLHDISEMPRAAWGGVERDLSGSALRIELSSLIQKVVRKRNIRTNVYHRRNQMILDLAQKYMNQNFEGLSHRVIWGPVLPQDIDRQAQTEQLLVQAGIHSRRTGMDELGIKDPDEEFARWLEERQKILEMNREFRAQSTRGGARERATAAEMEVPE